ncbi:uncharacterized protein LOC113144438 [Mastacembelus armatus]|uniref:uncharacterized protein LOC113144438 n=1 Tax=Mastacembelus armatus TaxID=205130 RepID=UPI000E457D7E|nr:uncharacterized protein LOC113144438 [Mastacembelus armatus]
MEQAVILLLMFAGVTHAVFSVADVKCNATQNTSQCSVTHGGSVYIQVMTSVSGYIVICNKKSPVGSVTVFKTKNGNVTIGDGFRNRTEFFIKNGTLKITNVEMSDSGQYTIELYDSNGLHVRKAIVQLDVQKKAPLMLILIIVGSVVGILLILVLLFVCICRKAKKKKSGRSNSTNTGFNFGHTPELLSPGDHSFFLSSFNST